MSIYKILKKEKFYKVPKRKITWQIDSYHLCLTVEMKSLGDYSGILPPKEFGKCKEYRVVNENPINYTYYGVWELRKIKNKLKFLEDINDRIIDIAIIDF